ncbi:MAG: hypothetical protein A3K65_05585 [Euryarchaeota archaeon RBG_16_68_12]|nr:MAG: hypothetical protein A3K65_05585 [Euryarchaeota archaeon RBG_16_68_12]
MADEQLRLMIALAIGIGPALLMMWLSLRRFDYPLAPKALFDDRRVFFALAVGLGFGVFASALTVLVASSGIGLILTLLAIALFESSFLLAYLNRRGYRGRFDTTFYGASLGVGVSATLGMATVYTQNPEIAGRPDWFAFLVPFSLSTSLALASVGSLIGYGTAHGQVLRYFTRAYLVRASHLLILAFFIIGGGDPGFSVALSVISLVASVVFAGVVYAFVYREILPETLPRDLRRTLRRWPGKAVKAKKPAKGSD